MPASAHGYAYESKHQERNAQQGKCMNRHKDRHVMRHCLHRGMGVESCGVKSHGYDSRNRADDESETISRIDFHNNL